ncbi:substrate-binding domain-containing protein [Polynucleobacter kasalickyi]|uniref:Molybdate transport system substrate-binding protein n=1 Tax=Polynucleobacter kasalickyi TaxID=1938817 RepID=A0A1W2B1T2_9BURK|nr:substrate-binding domain-containing protein [Polynucleobacter kasalickyi]SMC66945.1 molybdate transport system substrate-binding protein [Polynucleobacter kasalickyi]
MIKIYSSTAFKSILPTLLNEFEKQNGISTSVDFGTSNNILDRLHQGESADLMILTHEAINTLIDTGYCKKGTLKDLCKTSIGLAIAAEASTPNIQTTEDFVQAILATSSIAFTTKGASGVYFRGLIERLNVLDQIIPKAITPEGGLVAELILAGKAQMAIQLISELKAVPEVQLVGPLPPEINQTTVFTAGIGIHSVQTEVLEKLCAFLTNSSNQTLLIEKGLHPI